MDGHAEALFLLYKEVVVVKKICQVFFVLLVFLVGSSSVGSAEHWISMPSPDNGSQGFFDGDSAWFDSISRDGGVNMKITLPKTHGSAIFNVHFHLDADEANAMRGQVHIYNAAGYQIGEFYDGRNDSFANGTIGYEQIRRIANYARSK